MTEIWIATDNTGKLNEFSALFTPKDIKVHSQRELDFFSARPETGKTFIENARIKARALKSVKNTCWVLADDSGLEVKGLGGLPGIHSARYAGDKASDSENVAKLLKMIQMRTPSDRSAAFRIALVLFSPAGEEHVIEAELRGHIAATPQGQLGFGYDPIFVPEGQTQTMSQLGPSYKNQQSHRAQAVRKAIELIVAYPSTTAMQGV